MTRAVELIDQADYRPLPPAEPRPPLAARPRKLSVTHIETWLRDPYAIYARHILGLKALDELDADPGRAELGTAIHDALDEFVRAFPRGLPDNAEAELLRIGREQFGPLLSRPGAWAFWWPRFERIAVGSWPKSAPTAPGRGESQRMCREAGPSTRAAGLSRSPPRPIASTGWSTAALLLVDYKTGSVPKPKEVKAGFSPQLPLEGAILQQRRLRRRSAAGRAALEYWRLSGAEPAGERCLIGGCDAGALIDR